MNEALSIKEKSGKTGIRTLDTVTCITVFETAPFGHSGIFPLIDRIEFT